MAMHRRRFIGGILGWGCGSRLVAAEQPTRPRIGCYVSQAGQEPSQYTASTGVAKYDRTVKEAVDSVGRVIGRPVGAKVMFMKEYNAHFNPGANIIAFGKQLLDTIHGSDSKLKVTCIAAHEVAHIFQFEDGYFDLALTDATVRRNELMADHFAGCCLAFIVNGGRAINRGTLYRKKDSVRSAFQLMFIRGDNNFTDPNHHGTPAERLDAVDWGYETAFEVAGGKPVGDISREIMDVARFGQR
jgi:hypothetical protein